MIHRLWNNLWITAGISLLAPWGFSQETLSGVQREIVRVEKEIEREKKLHQTELKKAKEFTDRRKEKLAALQQQLKEMDGQIADLDKQQTRLKNQRAGLKGQAAQYEKRRQATGRHIAEQIDGLIAFFSKDFPHKRQSRVEDLEALKRDLLENGISPEEGMNRLFTFLNSAIADGYDTEVYSGTYENKEGKTVEGKFLRLGMAVQVFASLDGNTVAALNKGDSTYFWEEENLSIANKQNIKQAIKIAEGKAAPELVVLPIPNPDRGGQP